MLCDVVMSDAASVADVVCGWLLSVGEGTSLSNGVVSDITLSTDSV